MKEGVSCQEVEKIISAMRTKSREIPIELDELAKKIPEQKLLLDKYKTTMAELDIKIDILIVNEIFSL